MKDLSQCSRFDLLLHPPHTGRELEDVADRQSLAESFGQFDKRPCVFGSMGKRLLDEDMLASMKCKFGDLPMRRHGSHHHNRIVQTFTFEGDPDGVALETLWFEDLGGGRTRLRTQSLVDSFEGRDAWLRSGMETGVDEGYAKLDRMLSDGAL